jgi:hypothetical protein
MIVAALVLGTAAFLLLGLGVRLWRGSAARAPERWLALAFAALGAGATPRLLAARLLGSGEIGPLAIGLNAISQLVIELGIVAFTLFVWRVFRPASGAARAFAAGSALVSFGLTLAVAATAHATQEASALALAVNASRSLPVFWAFAECARYAVLMRRRVRLGLSEPVVANRFVLWSVWTGALGLAAIALLAIRARAYGFLRQGIDPHLAMPTAVPLAGTVVGLALGCAGVAVWLAFFPPAAYRRWLEARVA